MDASKTTVIAGPPGTGKTTHCLDIVDDLLEDKISPEKICFVAFTRRAANEARERANKRFNFTDQQLRYFRTLHSLAFQQLHLTRDQVMGFANYLSICKLLGISISGKVAEDGMIQGMEKGDRLFFMEGLSRSRMMPLRTLWESSPDEDIDWFELLQLAQTLEEFKRINCKLDFTDMISKFCSDTAIPDVDYMIVDEAQDLSAIQWSMVNKISNKVKRVWIAGDDDQAIFRWAGADVDTFINLQGDVNILDKSYRVPALVHDLADDMIKQVEKRRPKEWKPLETPGEIVYETDVENINMDSGTWLLLARNTFLLGKYADYCIKQGYVFDSITGSPVRSQALQAIKFWEQLRKGKTIQVTQARLVYDMMSIKVGVAYGNKGRLDALPDDTMLNMQDLRRKYGLLTEKIWHEALDRLNDVEREYFINALRRGEKLLQDPRIRINTIHGVKGAEADNVVIMTDMAPRTYKEYQVNPDDELRVWYVAVTRTKNALYILQPSSKYYFEI